jgi:hypothetical protein
MSGEEADRHEGGGPDRREGGRPRRRDRTAPARRGGATARAGLDAGIARVTVRLTAETAKRLAVGAELMGVDKSDLAEDYLAAGLHWVVLQRRHVPDRVPRLGDRGGGEKPEAADPGGGAAEEV